MKTFLQRKSTPYFLEVDLAIWIMWFHQHKFEAISTPKILIELRGLITLLSKIISKLEGSVETEIASNWVLVKLKLTKLSLPHPKLHSRSEFIVVQIVSYMRERHRELNHKHRGK